jgi:hypothetical protein
LSASAERRNPRFIGEVLRFGTAMSLPQSRRARWNCAARLRVYVPLTMKSYA